MILINLIFIIIISESKSNYKDAFYNKGKAIIAKPIININYTDKLITENANLETTLNSYNFQVINYEEDKINDVSIEYKIFIENKDNLPVTYNIINTDLDCNVTDKMQLLKTGEKQINNYRIDFSFDKNIDISKINTDNLLKLRIEAIQTNTQ